MQPTIEVFFQDYANAYDNQDRDTLVGMHMVPTVIMNDDQKRVCTSAAEIQDYVDDMMDKLEAAGVKRHLAEMTQCMRLSEKILFANVRWSFFDKAEQKLFSCYVSYTLQQSENGDIKIIILVLDDEDNALQQLLNG